MGKNRVATSSTGISKQLSLILRHTAVSCGLPIRSDGFVPLSQVLQLPIMRKLKATDALVRSVVQTNDKQRFALLEEPDGGTMIRANQGHSIEGINMNELCGMPIYDLKPGEVCCHGTYEQHVQKILKDGLKAGGSKGQAFRRDIHFSVKHPGQTVISGMRESCQVAVYVDLARAAADGILFYRSANDVILSEGIDGTIPPAYIDKIWDIRGQKAVLSSVVPEAPNLARAGLEYDELHSAVLFCVGGFGAEATNASYGH